MRVVHRGSRDRARAGGCGVHRLPAGVLIDVTPPRVRRAFVAVTVAIVAALGAVAVAIAWRIS